MRRVRLLVCGDPMRGDDALADAVLEALPEHAAELVDARHVGQLMPDDLIGAPGPVIVLDAVDGPPPGEVVDLPLDALVEADSRGIRPGSSHALPLTLTLAIVERLAGSLPEGRLIGVAGASYDIGEPLSPRVREAVPRCAARLHHWIRVLAHESRTSRCA